MRLLVPLIAALVPLLITPGALAYFDVTPRIVFLLFGTALILLYRAQNIRNVSAILGARVGESNVGRWWVELLAAQWLSPHSRRCRLTVVIGGASDCFLKPACCYSYCSLAHGSPVIEGMSERF
jgi:hypothetical protein